MLSRILIVSLTAGFFAGFSAIAKADSCENVASVEKMTAEANFIFSGTFKKWELIPMELGWDGEKVKSLAAIFVVNDIWKGKIDRPNVYVKLSDRRAKYLKVIEGGNYLVFVEKINSFNDQEVYIPIPTCNRVIEASAQNLTEVKNSLQP